MVKESGANLVGRIAWLYYDQRMRQQEIADFLGVSRMTVNRGLKEARDSGVVEIRIHEKHIRCFAIEEQLHRATGLDAVTVIPSAPDVIACLGSGAAGRFREALTRCRSIALGGGRTIASMVERLPRLKRIVTEHIVIMGEFADPEGVYDPETAAHILTTRLGVKCHQIEPLPVGASREVVEAIRRSPPVARAMQLAREADIAFVSACDVASSDTIFYGPVSETLRRELMAKGVVGEMEGTLYALDGTPRESSFGRRGCVTLPMKCPVVLVSGGAVKTAAIVGAIRGGFVDELITDSLAAEAVLGHFSQSRPAGPSRRT